jgi:hypothetical protein
MCFQFSALFAAHVHICILIRCDVPVQPTHEEITRLTGLECWNNLAVDAVCAVCVWVSSIIFPGMSGIRDVTKKERKKKKIFEKIIVKDKNYHHTHTHTHTTSSQCLELSTHFSSWCRCIQERRRRKNFRRNGSHGFYRDNTIPTVCYILTLTSLRAVLRVRQDTAVIKSLPDELCRPVKSAQKSWKLWAASRNERSGGVLFAVWMCVGI